MDSHELVAWARAEAMRLRDADLNIASTASAVEFLRVHGQGAFYEHAREAGETASHNARTGAGDRRGRQEVARVLQSWVDYIEAGLGSAVPIDARIRFEAATDLMEQVQSLLNDPAVIAAAPVMLAWAALEEALRGLMIGCDHPIVGTPSISKYSIALRKSDRISRQDDKNITAWAGLRNAAAHGQFEEVAQGEARIMVAGVNLFLQQHISA